MLVENSFWTKFLYSVYAFKYCFIENNDKNLLTNFKIRSKRKKNNQRRERLYLYYENKKEYKNHLCKIVKSL